MGPGMLLFTFIHVAGLHTVCWHILDKNCTHWHSNVPSLPGFARPRMLRIPCFGRTRTPVGLIFVSVVAPSRLLTRA